MTGKADAFRAVSQQFKERTNAVIEGVMAHLNDGNAKEILGPGLSPLIGRGTLKSLVTFALYADVLRMVRDMVMADGEISDEEVQESLGLISMIARGFAKVRSKEYAAFEHLTPETARQFLSQYESDAGLFGYAHTATEWAGVSICVSVEQSCNDSVPRDIFFASLSEWAKAITQSGEISDHNDEAVLMLNNTIASQLRSGASTDNVSAECAPVLTDLIARQFMADEYSVDLSEFRSIDIDAAHALASFCGSVNLSGIAVLTDSAARIMSTFQGSLDLSGVKSLSAAQAGYLAYYNGVSLTMEGLSDAPDEVISALLQKTASESDNTCHRHVCRESGGVARPLRVPGSMTALRLAKEFYLEDDGTSESRYLTEPLMRSPSVCGVLTEEDADHLNSLAGEDVCLNGWYSVESPTVIERLQKVRFASINMRFKEVSTEVATALSRLSADALGIESDASLSEEVSRILLAFKGRFAGVSGVFSTFRLNTIINEANRLTQWGTIRARAGSSVNRAAAIPIEGQCFACGGLFYDKFNLDDIITALTEDMQDSRLGGLLCRRSVEITIGDTVHDGVRLCDKCFAFLSAPDEH